MNSKQILIIPLTLISIGQTVYFSKSEEYWDKPFVKKRHHATRYRTVILKGIVIDIQGKEFKAKLIDNNGFEKDGQVFVFSTDKLLVNQDFKQKQSLGKWQYEDILIYKENGKEN